MIYGPFSFAPFTQQDAPVHTVNRPPRGKRVRVKAARKANRRRK